MSPKKKKTKKNPKKYRLELTFKSFILWFSGLFLLLVWIFILGILVGRGYLSFGIVKDKIAEVQDSIGDRESTDLIPAKKSDEDPKFAFYEELSSKKEAAAKNNRPTTRKKPAREKSHIKPDEKSSSLSKIPDSTQQYVIQIGSFNDKAKATALVDHLVDRKYPTFFSTASIDGKLYYRVKCGPFKTEKNADEFKKILSEKEAIHGFVTRAGR